MINTTFLQEQKIQRHTNLHIFLKLPESEIMSGRRTDFVSGNSSVHSSQADPRRRSMAIQDLLNPSVEDRGNTPRYSSQPSAHSGGQSSRPVARTSHYGRTSPPRTSRYVRTSPPLAARYPRTNTLQPASERPSSLRPPQVAQPRTRTSSVSSTKLSGTRREFRPTYSEEEALFIWYHRLDLGLDWSYITEAYNKQFPDRHREGVGGIQCKYYRCCQENNVPKVRERRRSASAAEEYGMKARTGLHFAWMRD